MKKIYYLFLIPLFIMSSCNSSSSKKQRQLTVANEMISYNLGFSSSAAIDYFEYHGKEYVGFADLRSHKRIALFDTEGVELFTVSVDSLMREVNERFLSFNFISPDTIALLTANSNRLFIIDNKGKVITKRDYSHLYLKGIKLSTPFYCQNGKMRAAIHYCGTNSSSSGSEKEELIYNHLDQLNFYNLLTDDYFDTITPPQLQLDSLYTRFIAPDEKNMEGTNILMLENSNIFYSAYSDSLYQYDLSGKLKKVATVKSDYTTTRIKPITTEQSMKDGQLSNRNFRENGFISDLYWDKYRKVYYCFVRDKMIENKIPFSIVILDEAFNKLEEIKMDYNKYWLSAFVGKEGLYLLHAIKGDFRIRNYTLFKYE